MSSLRPTSSAAACRASTGPSPTLKKTMWAPWHSSSFAIETFAALLHDAAFVIANLETPITDQGESPFSGIKSYVHYADVEKTPHYLSKYGIGLVSLANNHSLDYGLPGLIQTLEILDLRGIETCGAGGQQDRQAHNP